MRNNSLHLVRENSVGFFDWIGKIFCAAVVLFATWFMIIHLTGGVTTVRAAQVTEAIPYDGDAVFDISLNWPMIIEELSVENFIRKMVLWMFHCAWACASGGWPLGTFCEEGARLYSLSITVPMPASTVIPPLAGNRKRSVSSEISPTLFKKRYEFLISNCLCKYWWRNKWRYWWLKILIDDESKSVNLT